MNQLWEANFQVDGICKWNFYAANKKEAEEKADARFRADPYWSARYPVPPPCEVRQVPRPAARDPHDDVAPQD